MIWNEFVHVVSCKHFFQVGALLFHRCCLFWGLSNGKIECCTTVVCFMSLLISLVRCYTENGIGNILDLVKIRTNFCKYMDKLRLLFFLLGICMLLTVLEEQALDSLLLGPDKQNDFMQSILHTMEKEAAGN